LAAAAHCYLCAAELQVANETVPRGIPIHWPWDASWWKPKDVIRNLVRAGALIAAEIDRLRRMPEAAKDGAA
jgi:hypothetical protein